MKLKHIYEFGPFRLDAIERVLLREGKPVLVPPKDLETLLVLVESRGHIVEKNELLERVWPGTFVEEGNLTKHISNLRQLLGDGLNETTHIETIPRRGYRFVAPVNELEPVPAQTGNPRFVETLPRRGYRFIATANGWDAPAAIEGPRPQPAPMPGAKTALRVLGLAALVLAGVAVVLVGLNVSGWRERLLPRIQSLAVLPLENLSGDPSQEYFADGMTEELITQLGKIRALRVISRTSVNRYKGTKKPLPEIARELDVDAVVEGTVARSGSRVRVTANLVRVSPEKHLWSERYERDLRDVLLIQQDVAQAVANEIRVQLTPRERERLSSAHQVNSEAFEDYLKGRYLWNKRTEEDLKKALQYFQLAIEKDPSYARAYAGLADTYGVLGSWALDALPPSEGASKQRATASKALEIDETLAEAHASLGGVMHLYDWNWQGAEAEYRRAIELNPGYATAHHWYSQLLQQMGRFDECLAEGNRAQQLDPLSPVISASFGWRFYLARRYDAAIEHIRKTSEIEPNFVQAHWYLGQVYEQKGKYSEAIAELQQAAALSKGAPIYLGALAHAYAVSGQRAEAAKVLAKLKERSREHYVSPYNLAVVYTGLGEREEAFEWLERAYQDRSPWMANVKLDPRLDPLHSDPRFQGLLRRIGLPQ